MQGEFERRKGRAQGERTLLIRNQSKGEMNADHHHKQNDMI